MAQTSTTDDGSNDSGSGSMVDRVVSFLQTKTGMAVALAVVVSLGLAYWVI